MTKYNAYSVWHDMFTDAEQPPYPFATVFSSFQQESSAVVAAKNENIPKAECLEIHIYNIHTKKLTKSFIKICYYISITIFQAENNTYCLRKKAGKNLLKDMFSHKDTAFR